MNSRLKKNGVVFGEGHAMKGLCQRTDNFSGSKQMSTNGIFRAGFGTIFGLVGVLATSTVLAQPCTVPETAGTVILPPAGCGYVSPTDLHEMINGLPPGTTIQVDANHNKFFNVTTTPGGSLGGHVENFNSILSMNLHGQCTGPSNPLCTYNRVLSMQIQCQAHTGPRTLGVSPQDFDNDMFGMQGQLPPGDPDFDLLRITAGTSFGMPSPGHTTLTRLGPPGSNWNVDSFFDITYRIDFVGHPGGPLGGMSGSTTGTIRMQTGGPVGGVPCCLPLGLCVNTSTAATCTGQGGTPLPAGTQCAGDTNGDGIDDSCFVGPCEFCGPGPHWIDNPACPPGGQNQETLPSGAVLGIDTNLDCIADTNVVAGGPVTIREQGPVDDATFYPGTRPIDGHLDVINTQIMAMSLTGGGVNLKAGTLSGSVQPLQPSRGVIAEQPSNPNLADSFFDVFFEIEYSPGLYAYNHVPIQVAQTISCKPPQDNYYHLGGCTPLYSSPTGGTVVANLVQANHFTYPACCVPLPTGNGCTPNVSVQQCQSLGGTPVPACLGDNNANGVDDACDPACTRDPTTASGCSSTCPPPTTPNEQCLPKTAGCNINQQGSCGVLECECQDPNICHLVKDTAGYHCEGGCSNGVDTCTLLGDGHFGNPIRCDCVGTPGCVPNADASDCEQVNCPGPVPPTDHCQKKCVKIDAAGNIEVTDCECEPATNCHVEVHQGPVPRGVDGGVAGGGNGCIVPNDGGTVDLPPSGCDYLSPNDVHMIIAGLPPNTEIHLAPIHSQIFCKEQNNVCSFPPGVECEQGTPASGQQECASSMMQFQLQCVSTGPGGCPGTLSGWSRPVTLPQVDFETHVQPRTPGDPVQSFDTEMFRLFGQITNPGSGDPDFDLLRVVAGNDFGLPSPGHTTLTQLPGGSWAVDSFFDITYRIDFVGKPGGHLGGMSGSTTGTIRMQTTPPVKCEGDCPAGTNCVQTNVPQADGTNKICCDCVTIPTICEPNAAGTDCNPVQCPAIPGAPTETCRKKCVKVDTTGNVTVTDCDCQPDTDCHMELLGISGRGTEPADGGVAGGPNPCIEPDAGGTVVLPPPGLDCPYVSPDDFHEIIAGLPAGTTVQVGIEHGRFVNIVNQPGGNLGGEKETFGSSLTMTMNGQCTGPINPICTYSRNVQMQVNCETHIGPRTPGDPVQSMDNDMFMLQGQLPPGDPDFDLLRITAGTGFGMPSPGHTTLTQLPGGTNWAVDSFFDITYRIDFIGHSPGPFGGMSGSTTGTIRMQTPGAFKCRGQCPTGTNCIQTNTPQPDGTNKVCCECVNNDPTGACCTTGAVGNLCVNTTQSQCQGTFIPGVTCSGIMVACCLPSGACAQMDEVCCTAAGGSSIVGGTCSAPQGCCFQSGTCQNLDPVCCQAQGGTPLGAGNNCLGDLDGNGHDDACERCVPTADGTGCTNPICNSPVPEQCQKRCAKFNPATGQITVTECDCRGTSECHLVYPGSGAARDGGEEDVGAVAGGPNGCIVPDDGGTVDLPPAGCDYLSPSQVHMIIDGLPPNTEIHLAPIHSQIFCHEQNNVCSFPPGIECEQSGGDLGGQKECASSTMQFQLQCVSTGAGGCPGTLAGFNRTVVLPDVGFETHVGPRTPGQPSQSFDTEMFRLFGQIVNPGSGDPDFDLLRITAGNDFGLPSPGHTTLTRLGPPGSSWAVDSFFDITYRIDFVGRPGGHLGGMSGSTTGTIRMATTPPFKCVGGCGPRRSCTPLGHSNVDGTLSVCCDCRPRIPNGDPTAVNKSRFVSFSLAPAAVAGGAETNAIRVKLVSLHHVNPPYQGGPSVPFTAFEGQVRYVGPPAVFLESVSTGIRFVASQLQCAPYYRDWSSFSSCSLTPTICTTNADCPMGGTCSVALDTLLHVTGSAITPSSTFEVQVLGSICAGVEENCDDVSDPLEMKTTRWGDVETPFNPPSTTTQPDLQDVSSLVNKFKSAPGAPIKARSLLAGDDTFGTINMTNDLSFIHIAACVDAFKGKPYPHDIATCP